MRYVVALDQGTTSSRTVIFDQNGVKVASASREFDQLYPKPGWVEHRPEDILSSQLASLKEAICISGISADDIAAVGIANQRETTLIWDRTTGEPIYNAIVWQCRRTAPLVERLSADGLNGLFRKKTGLIPDAYFSATKIQWLLDETPGARERAERGELCFGTVDSFLTWHLTGGAAHVTDATNAGRTMLFDIRTQQWDEELLRALRIPISLMPKVVDSAQVVGMMKREILDREIPIAALAGDQHAALYGQGCFVPGMVKNTYGTGCFMLMNTGSTPVVSQNNLLTTMAWRVDGRPVYALEGSVFAAGAVVKWLRDEMGLIRTATDSEAAARAVSDNGNVYMVPAFTGLGAPYWDMYGRGLIIGLTRGTGRNHIVRAALESIAYQSKDLLEAMSKDSGLAPSLLRADGGASANNFLMQFQADIMNVRLSRPLMVETTALGVGLLAGRSVGIWNDRDLRAMNSAQIEFSPQMGAEERARLYRGWKRAVERAMKWEEEA